MNGPSDPDDPTPDLVAGAKAGEEWALAALYRDLHPRLVRYLRAFVPGQEEDLASDVWIELPRSLDRFEGDRDALGRLAYTIARRRALDQLRKQRRRRTEPTDGGALEDLEAEVDPEREVIERTGSMEAVDRIIALLPRDQAEIVLLRVVAGLGVAEVAEIVRRRPGAVSVLQHRALRQLARLLGPEDPEPGGSPGVSSAAPDRKFGPL